MAHSVVARFPHVALPDGQVLEKVGSTANVSNTVFDALSDAGVVGGSGAALVSDGGVVTDTHLDGDDAVSLQAAVVAAPAALTSAAATGGDAPTEAEYNALRTDVANLRTTLAATLAALKGTDKPMSAT